MSRDEIALQLTLKSIEKMGVKTYPATLAQDNLEFSNQVVDFYNNIYKKLDLDNTVSV